MQNAEPWRGRGAAGKSEAFDCSQYTPAAAEPQHPTAGYGSPSLSELGIAALEYAERGLRVLPCRPSSKLPLIAGWPEKATTDADQIRRRWSASPDANVAVATGPASGLFVLDVDDEASLLALEREHGSLPGLYPQSWTGRGWQCRATIWVRSARQSG